MPFCKHCLISINFKNKNAIFCSTRCRVREHRGQPKLDRFGLQDDLTPDTEEQKQKNEVLTIRREEFFDQFFSKSEK